MDYLLLNEVEVRSVDLSENQLELRRAVQRIIADEDASTVARELLERKIVSGAEIIEMMVWIKNNREHFQVKPRFKSLNRRGRR
jgi:ribosomal protein S24E